ncbi:MAG: aspartyl/asparaginyl beta-hydroxylase domain-containing protein [Planctomycetota bacterium]|nr:aspartyl/asparaginyl beta-hydroxylase domain-containing protein [Planctomycetota bacterium]
MENEDFLAAHRELKRHGPDSPLPPPHALWRLGRVLLGRKQPRKALLPLEMFQELYPEHRDRPEVIRDLALALKLSGQTKKAAAITNLANA